MEEQLKLEGYSYRTRKTYLQHMKQLVAYHKKDPRQLAAPDTEKSFGSYVASQFCHVSSGARY